MKLLVDGDLGSACFDTGVSCCLVSIKLSDNRATHFYFIPAVLLQYVPPPTLLTLPTNVVGPHFI